MAEVTSALRSAIATACKDMGWQNDTKRELVQVKTRNHHGAITYQAIADLREEHSCTSKEALRRSWRESGLAVELTKEEAAALPVITDLESVKYLAGTMFVKSVDELTIIAALKSESFVQICEIGDDGEPKELPVKILAEK